MTTYLGAPLRLQRCQSILRKPRSWVIQAVAAPIRHAAMQRQHAHESTAGAVNVLRTFGATALSSVRLFCKAAESSM